ncbi:MAG: hypothetical protein MI923_15730 [Phycisphaerales bacterium]|nr:hypothetical protein [Phycisphaerales bacterium]
MATKVYAAWRTELFCNGLSVIAGAVRLALAENTMTTPRPSKVAAAMVMVVLHAVGRLSKRNIVERSAITESFFPNGDPGSFNPLIVSIGEPL